MNGSSVNLNKHQYERFPILIIHIIHIVYCVTNSHNMQTFTNVSLKVIFVLYSHLRLTVGYL